jgi:hypothetical protein
MGEEVIKAKCPLKINAVLVSLLIEVPFRMKKNLLLVLFGMLVFGRLAAQNLPFAAPGIEVNPSVAEGVPIRTVLILLYNQHGTAIANAQETDAFYQAFQIKPGTIFRQVQMDLAVSRMRQEASVYDANYVLYNSEFAGPVILIVRVQMKDPSLQQKAPEARSGMLVKGSAKGFPTLLETSRSKLTLLLNGGAGLFNEVNAFHGQGAAFTKGNSVATDPAGKGVRFWGEMYAEPGIAGITQLGKSKVYAYGALSVMFTGRNTSDIYSKGGTGFTDLERAYAGLLWTGIGKKKNLNIDLSAGRQFFQLNDGFLFAKFSGSANAGRRGSVYLNARTSFEKTVLLKAKWDKFGIDGFILEPTELFKDRQSNTRYGGAILHYNDNQHWDLGLSYIEVLGGKASYSTPFGSISKKGMFVVNPKIWVKDIGGTGAFVRSEYAFQSHHNANMRSAAYYLGLGLSKSAWKFKPSFYYRYAFMKGDDSLSNRYERFDPMLIGGLGNWVQGINSRKLVGSGNIISHRLEVKAYIKDVELSVDYFNLSADSYSNLGGLAPIATLKKKQYAQEITFTCRKFFGTHFLLLGILSYSDPGAAFEAAFEEKIYPWTSVQAAVFMFF